MATARRRGRPPAGEEGKRRDEALDAALAELVEHGYEATTMLAVARRARSSKESLYTWFGSKEGLFAAIVRREAEQTNEGLRRVLASDGEPRDALVTMAANLLRLLTGERSVALNRAAMSSPGLARVLLEHGRHRTGPLVEEYLDRLAAAGHVAFDDAGDAFALFYGLVVRDAQIRTLLGEPPPSERTIGHEARRAVDRFLALTAPR